MEMQFFQKQIFLSLTLFILVVYVLKDIIDLNVQILHIPTLRQI